MNRQQDVEIYVCGCPLERAIEWARSMVGSTSGPFSTDTTIAYHLEEGDGAIVIMPKVEDGPFTSVWFNTQCRPWATDVECAREAVAVLNCVVRCDPGDTVPRLSPYSDMWLELEGHDERVIHWEDDDA